MDLHPPPGSKFDIRDLLLKKIVSRRHPGLERLSIPGVWGENAEGVRSKVSSPCKSKTIKLIFRLVVVDYKSLLK